MFDDDDGDDEAQGKKGKKGKSASTAAASTASTAAVGDEISVPVAVSVPAKRVSPAKKVSLYFSLNDVITSVSQAVHPDVAEALPVAEDAASGVLDASVDASASGASGASGTRSDARSAIPPSGGVFAVHHPEGCSCACSRPWC